MYIISLKASVQHPHAAVVWRIGLRTRISGERKIEMILFLSMLCLVLDHEIRYD